MTKLFHVLIFLGYSFSSSHRARVYQNSHKTVNYWARSRKNLSLRELTLKTRFRFSSMLRLSP
jgi:hypothetical protein